jgi:hypothetical protein
MWAESAHPLGTQRLELPCEAPEGNAARAATSRGGWPFFAALRDCDAGGWDMRGAPPGPATRCQPPIFCWAPHPRTGGPTRESEGGLWRGPVAQCVSMRCDTNVHRAPQSLGRLAAGSPSCPYLPDHLVVLHGGWLAARAATRTTAKHATCALGGRRLLVLFGRGGGPTRTSKPTATDSLSCGGNNE